MEEWKYFTELNKTGGNYITFIPSSTSNRLYDINNFKQAKTQADCILLGIPVNYTFPLGDIAYVLNLAKKAEKNRSVHSNNLFEKLFDVACKLTNKPVALKLANDIWLAGGGHNVGLHRAHLADNLELINLFIGKQGMYNPCCERHVRQIQKQEIKQETKKMSN